jgi:hypothetical protein
MDHYVYTFNVITATLLLVTARVYLSFETPYDQRQPQQRYEMFEAFPPIGE